jgi:probable HAF family extracellular repeat protein
MLLTSWRFGRVWLMAMALGAGMLASTGVHAQSYRFQVLHGVLTPASAARVGDNNWVVGTSGLQEYIGSPTIATVWVGAQATGYQDPAFQASSAYGVNVQGDVAGRVVVGGASAASVWHAGVPRLLPVPIQGPYPLSAATDINAAGQIVGVAMAANGRLHASLWEGETYVDLSPGSSDETHANAISAKGIVVGERLVPGIFLRPLKWVNHTQKELPMLPDGMSSAATAINKLGVIVGYSDRDANLQGYLGGSHAVRWDGNLITDLHPADAQKSWANGISDTNIIVGARQLLADGSTRATIWLNQAPLDLTALIAAEPGASDWALDEAMSVNKKGYIVGNMTHRQTGEQAVFLLAPRPAKHP